MNRLSIFLVFDGDAGTALSVDIRQRLTELGRGKGCRVGEFELRKDTTPPCTGCLRCLTEHPGQCVFHGSFSGIMELAAHCPVIIFLTPVLFGTYSSTMKNVIDRGGLIIRNHGSCRQIVIGYGEDATEEERSTFIDITEKHRGKADIVHPNIPECFDVYFTRSPEDNERILQSLGNIA